jgi:3alpha(or 20beta)-hydroxysteroid dehydrogenase
MPGRLDGQIVLITGGARGQGEQEARLFTAEGATVVIADVLDDQGEAVAADLDRCTYAHLDVTDADAWAALVTEMLNDHERIDVLINNAAIYHNDPLAETSPEDYRRVIEVNQTGVFLGMRAVAPAMTAARSGSIINLSSGAGLRGATGRIAYSASKWAVRGMTKVAALELAPFDIRVNSIHPGPIATDMLQLSPDVAADPAAAMRRVPLGRFGSPEEVARMALFLASDESSFSTGAEFILDGGTTI